MDYKSALTNLDLVYPDGVAKGFPLWTTKGMKMQNEVIKIFLDVFSDVGNIEINYPKQIQNLDEFILEYKDRINKYDNTLPIFNVNHKNYLFITDNLPYNLKKMDKEEKTAMLTYYYVLRLLDAKQIPMCRDYYISPLLQFNIIMNNKSKNEAIKYIIHKMKNFCKRINLPEITLEYAGVEGYSDKVFMVSSLNRKLDTQTILQCSLLSNELLDSFHVSENLKNKLVFDIGYSQKIFAYLAENNMDEYGMRLPSIFNQKDIAIIYNSNTKIINKLKKRKNICEKVYFDDTLGKRKLKTIKNYYIDKGVRTLFIQNYIRGEEFFLLYSIRGKQYKINRFEEIYKIIEKEKFELDRFYYDKMDEKLQELRNKGYSYVSEFKEKGEIINCDGGKD